jgi:predicted DsbA family dithiol-disulfide isomerase
VGAVRLHTLLPEFAGRVKLKIRPYPLEILDNDPAPRDILEQEWWLAALQEPAAAFAPYPQHDWPTTTLPAFDAAHASARQGNDALLRYDLAVRTAFFGRGRNIGRLEVLVEIARETGLDVARFERDVGHPSTRAAVLDEARMGREHFGVQGTPTLMLPDGTKLHHPLVEPHLKRRRITGVDPLPCHGDGCLELTRALLERAAPVMPSPPEPADETPTDVESRP